MKKSEVPVKTTWDIISEAMQKKGIGKQKLAEIAGVAPSAVTKWARGGAIRSRNLFSLESALGISLTRKSETQDGAGTSVETPEKHACRFPADFDLIDQLSEQRAAMAEQRAAMAEQRASMAEQREAMQNMQGQLRTLNDILGSLLAHSGAMSAHDHKRKAG